MNRPQSVNAASIYADLTHALTGKRLALLLPDLHGGGVQRVVLRLADGFSAAGAEVDLVVCDARGYLRDLLPPAVRLVGLKAGSPLGERLRILRIARRAGVPSWRRLALEFGRSAAALAYVGSLADYLGAHRPDALFAATPYPNMQAIMAREWSRCASRVIVSERNHFSSGKRRKVQRAGHISAAMHDAYRRADGVIAVSRGVARDLAATIDLDENRLAVVHNPTLTPDFEERLAEPVAHRWFDDPRCKVAVAVGRIGLQKDYPTMLKALAIARRRLDVRLLIVGEVACTKRAKGTARLEAFIRELGLADHVELLGYLRNPLPYMAKADLFLLSSRFEGFPNVLLEALGAGVNIVSTRCPSGPDEILDDGRFGWLVPVADPAAMADAIVGALSSPKAREFLKSRTKVYGYHESLRRYAEILLGAEIAA